MIFTGKSLAHNISIFFVIFTLKFDHFFIRLNQKNELQTKQGIKQQPSRNSASKRNRKAISQNPESNYSLFSTLDDSEKLSIGRNRENTNHTPMEHETILRRNIYPKEAYPSGSAFSYSASTNEKTRHISPSRSPLKGGSLFSDMNSIEKSKDSVKREKPQSVHNIINKGHGCDEDIHFLDLKNRISPCTDLNVMEGSNTLKMGLVRTEAVPIRPPPGLPPPPGFASESDASVNFKKSAVDLLHDESISITSSNEDVPKSPILHSQNINHITDNLVSMMQSSLLGESAPLNLPEASLSSSNQGKIQVSAIGSEREIMGSKLRMSENGLDSIQSNMTSFGFDGGFNIENYVTHILNESSDLPRVGKIENDHSKATNSMPIGGNMNYNLNNPWKSSLGGKVALTNEGSKPRITEYGISSSTTNTVDTDLTGNIVSSFDNDYQYLKMSQKNDTGGLPENNEHVETFDDRYLGSKVTSTYQSDISSSLKDDEIAEDDFFNDDAFLVSLVGK